MGNCGYVYIGQAKEWTLVGILSFMDLSAPQPIFILGESLVNMFVGGVAPHYFKEG